MTPSSDTVSSCSRNHLLSGFPHTDNPALERLLQESFVMCHHRKNAFIALSVKTVKTSLGRLSCSALLPARPTRIAVIPPRSFSTSPFDRHHGGGGCVHTDYRVLPITTSLHYLQRMNRFVSTLHSTESGHRRDDEYSSHLSGGAGGPIITFFPSSPF